MAILLTSYEQIGIDFFQLSGIPCFCNDWGHASTVWCPVPSSAHTIWQVPCNDYCI